MPKATEHLANDTVKMLLIGDSGSGKTGSLISLVEAGYKLFILDFDNGLDIVINSIRKRNPALLENIVYENLRDKKAAPGQPEIIPKAFETAVKLINHWKFPERKGPRGITYAAEDYGSLSQWDNRSILVIDSLTHFGTACMNWCKYYMPQKDGRQDYFNAQQKLESILGHLYSDLVSCNVIIISHIQYIGEDDKEQIGFPSTSLGKAIAPKIATYVNSLLQVKLINGKRFILTTGDKTVTCKTTLIEGMPERLPVETGLATYFSLLLGETKTK